MERVWGEVRLAGRGLVRSPMFTISTTAILALAIGMSTAMFQVYKTVLLQRLPLASPDRLVIMHPLDRRGTHLDAPGTYLATVARDTLVFREAAGVLHRGAVPVPLLDGSTSIRLATATASANFFDVLGMRPLLGRLFRAEDGVAGAAPVIILSYPAWSRWFGRDTSIVGRTLVLPFTLQHARVIGVTPAGFQYPAGTDAWVPTTPDDATAQVDIIARLAPNVSVAAAHAAFFALTQRANPFVSVFRAGQKPYDVADVDVQRLTETVLGSSRPTLVALTLAVAVLLLIACVNVGNLVLLRLIGRAREIAVRKALGARHSDVARLLAMENVLLGIIGGALGFVIAVGLLKLVSLWASTQLPHSDALSAAAPPLQMAAALTAIAILLFGAVPSIIAAGDSHYTVLRRDLRTGGEGRARRRARRLLVSTQIALALVLLTGAGLLVRTMANLESMDLGYHPEHLSVIAFTGPENAFPTAEKQFEVSKALVTRLEAIPDVIAATSIENMPFQGQSSFIMQLSRAEQPVAEREHNPLIPWEFVSPDYFRVFRIPILRGRGFGSADTKSSEPVVVINESLAKALWPNENALGRQIQTPDNRTWTVVGIARDTHFRELKKGGPVVYFHWEQVQPFSNGYLAVRSRSTLGAVLPSIRAATKEVNPSLVIWDAQTMDQLLDEPMALPRMSARLWSGFSVVALLLSAIGLYGVISTTVRQQTREIGIRVALGATARNIRRLVLGDAMRIVASGAGAGLVAALLSGKLLASQLFGVAPVDPISVASAAALLIVVAAGAAYVPAHFGSRTDPVTALRSE